MEAELLRLRRRPPLAVVAVLGVAALLCGGTLAQPTSQGRPSSRPGGTEIRASRFVVEDDDGNARIKLGLIDGAPSLAILDEKARVRAFLSVMTNGPVFNLSAEDGKTGVTVGQMANDRRWIMAVGNSIAEKGSAIVLGFDDYKPCLLVTDKAGQTRASLTLHDAGSPTLGLFDDKGELRTTLGYSKTTSADGKNTTYPESSLLLFGPDGSVRWQTP